MTLDAIKRRLDSLTVKKPKRLRVISIVSPPDVEPVDEDADLIIVRRIVEP